MVSLHGHLTVKIILQVINDKVCIALYCAVILKIDFDTTVLQVRFFLIKSNQRGGNYAY